MDVEDGVIIDALARRRRDARPRDETRDDTARDADDDDADDDDDDAGRAVDGVNARGAMNARATAVMGAR